MIDGLRIARCAGGPEVSACLARRPPAPHRRSWGRRGGGRAGALVLAEMDGEEVSLIQQFELIDAAKQGNIERVGALLNQGAAVDSRDWDFMGQRTPLMEASLRGHIEVAALLLDSGANVNAKNARGQTPAMFASWKGHLDTLQLLISRGADMHHRNHGGNSSLLWAALFDHLPVCEYLLSLGADLTVVSQNNQTALVDYGYGTHPPLPPSTKALRVAALEAWWAAGPHPSQVQRRRDERWARRGPLITVLAEHAYRPLQLRALAMALAAAELDPAAPIEPVALATSQQRHAHLLGRVLSCEGIVRLLVALL